SVSAQNDVNSPYNRLKNGGLVRTSSPDARGFDHQFDYWTVGQANYSPNWFMPSAELANWPGATIPAREGIGSPEFAAVLTEGPTATVLYQQFTIAPIPVRNCFSVFHAGPSCSLFRMDYYIKDYSDLSPDEPRNTSS